MNSLMSIRAPSSSSPGLDSGHIPSIWKSNPLPSSQSSRNLPPTILNDNLPVALTSISLSSDWSGLYYTDCYKGYPPQDGRDG
ncbi:hypothetical protein ACOMHN_049739 [Nucella lapillus]